MVRHNCEHVANVTVRTEPKGVGVKAGSSAYAKTVILGDIGAHAIRDARSKSGDFASTGTATGPDNPADGAGQGGFRIGTVPNL
jgi:hypothetical protein